MAARGASSKIPRHPFINQTFAVIGTETRVAKLSQITVTVTPPKDKTLSMLMRFEGFSRPFYDPKLTRNKMQV